MNKNISIIIPHYGKTGILKQLLKSIVGQNYNNYEIIVINNNLVKLDEKKFMINKLRIINLETNRGYSYSCNRGAKIAKFKNLFFISNDCTLENKFFLRKLSKNILKLRNNIVIGPKIIFRNKDVYKEGLLTIDIFSSPGQSLNKFFYLDGCSIFIDKNFFLQILSFDERYFLYSEDVDICWRVWLFGGNLQIDHDIYVNHEGGASSLGHNYEKEFTIPYIRRYNAEKNALCNLIKNFNFLSITFILPLYLFFLLIETIFHLLTGNFKMSIYLFKSLFWNIYNIKKTIEIRNLVQANRKISDLSVLKKMNFIPNKFTYLKLGIPKFK